MALVPNRPTLEGRLLGQEIARLTEAQEQQALRRFPKHKTRCQSCAFRQGTIPNGNPNTIMDALKCAIEGRTFSCHQTLDAQGEPTEVCIGWLLSQQSGTFDHVRQAIGRRVPWPFSDEEDDHARA
jgi:hypothetical protein